ARLRNLCIQLAQWREQTGVGGRVGARRAADRRLVDVDHLVEQVEIVDGAMRGDRLRGTVELVGGQRVQGVVDQRRFARTGDAGNAGQQARGNGEVDRLQIVAAGAMQ